MSHFKKALNLWDSVAVITAIVIGVGIFRVGSDVAAYLRSPFFILAAWFLGGLISLLGALCYAELASSFPKTGGNYVYLKESYGETFAFLYGWADFFVIRSGSLAAISFIAADYLQTIFPPNHYFTRPIAILIIVALSVINLFGINYGKKVHNTLTVLNISTILGLVILGLFSSKGSMANFAAVSAPDYRFLPALGLALIPILWTYGGWHETTFVAEETKDASKTLPRSLVIGVCLVMFLYVALNALYLYLMPVRKIASSVLIGSDAFNILCGKNGGKIFSAVVVMASLGCINATIITGSRLTYALARDNPVFSCLARLDAKYASPRRAIVVIAIWASVLVVLGQFRTLLFFTGILAWFFFAAVVTGLFVLRKKFPDLKRPYKVWGYPYVPGIFIFICIILFLNTMVFKPLPSLAGLCLFASGIPVYMVSQYLSRKRR